MIRVNIRQQGGAAVFTIPSDLLKLLELHVGDTLELDVSNQSFTARRSSSSPKKYSLQQLLEGTTLAEIKKLNKVTKKTREGGAVGRELA